MKMQPLGVHLMKGIFFVSCSLPSTSFLIISLDGLLAFLLPYLLARLTAYLVMWNASNT